MMIEDWKYLRIKVQAFAEIKEKLNCKTKTEKKLEWNPCWHE